MQFKTEIETNKRLNNIAAPNLLIITILSFVFLLGLAILPAHADTAWLQSNKITINYTNAPLSRIISDIEQKSGYSILVRLNDVDVKERYTISRTDTSIDDILSALFAGRQIGFEVEGKTISVFAARNTAMAPQNRRLTGTVSDSSGEAIIWAIVTEKGTFNSVPTGVDGRFSLALGATGSITLVVSSLGFLTQEVTVAASQSDVTVTLQQDIQSLDEVIVVGYGTARKGDLTGSISSVGGEALASRSTQQLSTALQGQISGVQVTRNSGAPGSSSTIRVRGVTTISNNDPLVIVDGVPSAINDVLAADVETMTVLKDAAAASIYGSRAAAGVILITTKRAKSGQFSFDYNYEHSIDTPTTRPENGDVIDWMNMQNEIKWNEGAADAYSMYSQETINSWMTNHATDPWHYPNTDWVNQVLKKTTSSQRHSLSVSGGTDKLLTKFNFNYQKGDGYYANRSYERFAGRVNNDYTITPWLKANIDLDFSKSSTISPSSGLNPIYLAFLTSPYYTPRWEDGRWADAKDGANPLPSLLDGGTNNQGYYKFGAKMQIDITPLKDLTLTAIVAPRFSFQDGKEFQRAVTLYYENNATVMSQWHKQTNLYETRNRNNSQTYQFYANYRKDLGDHSLSAMAGYEGYAYKWENLGANRTNYLLDTYPYLNIGPEDFQYNSGSAGHNAYSSVFGRLMYSYKNKYLFQGNIRSDASSRFAKDYRWATFLSASAGWVMSGESWFENNVVNYLKLRGSIGQLGNERIGSEFPYQAAMSFGNSYMYDKGPQSVTAIQNAAQVYYAFEDITWETTTTYGVGIDAAFLRNRLSLTADWYYKKTGNMLLEVGFPSYAGFSAPQQNAGDMYTKGWEIDLGWRDEIGDFWYSVAANLSDYRARMGYLGDRRTIDGNYIREKGSYYNEWFMYRSAGLFVTDADLVDADGNKYPTLTARDGAGTIKYVDSDESGTINADDKIPLGNSLPEYLYGGNIAAGWRNLDFNLSFQGVGHQRVLFQSDWIQPLKEQHGAVPKILLGNYWSKHNTEEQNRNARYPMVTYNNTANIYAGSDYWLFNGGYFRVKNITLGYTLPEKLTGKFFVKNLRFYASVNDLPAISNFPKGWDPEVGSRSDFISTSYIFGVNVKF